MVDVFPVPVMSMNMSSSTGGDSKDTGAYLVDRRIGDVVDDLS